MKKLFSYQRWDSALTRRIERVYNIPPNGLIWVEIEARDDNFTSISFNVSELIQIACKKITENIVSRLLL